MKAEYKSAKYYYNLENKKVEKIHDLIQTFKDKNEDINIDIQHYYDIIKTYVENNEEVKILNSRLSKLLKKLKYINFFLIINIINKNGG